MSRTSDFFGLDVIPIFLICINPTAKDRTLARSEKAYRHVILSEAKDLFLLVLKRKHQMLAPLSMTDAFFSSLLD